MRERHEPLVLGKGAAVVAHDVVGGETCRARKLTVGEPAQRVGAKVMQLAEVAERTARQELRTEVLRLLDAQPAPVPDDGGERVTAAAPPHQPPQRLVVVSRRPTYATASTGVVTFAGRQATVPHSTAG